ncbi:MAG TPA: anhydro-N-acetylmuramic acid kinase [Terriglobales bacterium]
MIVAGVMSGTSADGIDVAIVRLVGRGFRTKLELLSRYEAPYPAKVRRVILAAMNAKAAKVADLARLNFLLGELYADAIYAAAKSARLKLDLIGCHGQTLYHQGDFRPYLGRDMACTWQTGEGSIIAARTRVPVVTDFRPADMAAGGLGAPLVPFLDYLLYRHERRGRIVQNIGGIANFSAIPAGAAPEQVIAFDTGPGNMVIDAVTEKLFGKPFDRDGRLAAKGKPIENVLDRLLRGAFFRRHPPKTAGREEFGREYVASFLKMCRGAKKEDVVATATALTARSIAGSVRMFMVPPGSGVPQFFHEFIASGGGSKNRTLMKMIGEQLPELSIKTSDDFGLPSESKEAVAFAVLAYQTWQRLPGNLPAATGAERAAVLGKISYP